ncbi:DUF1566 domain-containing protein [Flavobacterium sp. N1994]|uniref:Lcl domain-containing protein n=1 Tax=Flavobacterium sp. N1994 TaxID=2986827 RepID=UPI00222274CE|nr:DUF1566 domain-containing protein [Flavobacterium sp. N1994]
MKRLIFVLITAVSFSQSVTKSIALLPDTGQTASYTNTFGEDNDYSINTPSYTNNGNGTITDTVTGLMWQQVDGGEMTIENATSYCDGLVLGGFSDWRLPTPLEAFSLQILQNNNPAMNTTYFTASAAEYWWTSKFQAGDNTKVWCTNAGGGIGNHPKSETISAGGTKRFHVRAVRDMVPSIVLANHFTDNGDGTITDNLTQLTWQKVPNASAMTWEQALTYAEGLTLGSTSDWRLPNIKELQSLNDESVTNPSVNTAFFGSIGVKNYWSSTTLKPNTTNPSSAWYWNTQFGITTYDVKANSNYVICVRGNPSTLNNATVIQEDHSFKVFPNPFQSKINVSNTLGNEYFELFDESGKQLYAGKNISKQDFSSLAKGIYILKIISNIVTRSKLIKE